jgi:hypothetical protein
MNPLVPQSSPPSPAPAPVDRVRMIRRSTRCFVFGIFGAIPFFGLSLAWLAFRLQRQLARDTGDRIDTTPLYLMSAVALELLVLFLSLELVFLALASATLCLCLPLFLIQRQYRRAEPPEWNPARPLVYWGIGLAYTGVILSGIILVIVCWLVLEQQS